MQNQQQIGQIVIVGGGPVGNFTAVMVGMLGVRCTVYQKRDTYTRQINLKIQKDFFKDVHKVMCRVSRRQRQFLIKFNQQINQNNGKVLLKVLEQRMKEQAVSLGVKYITKQILTFQEAQQLHKNNNPLILDCTGRKSPLRISKFGDDDVNMETFNLHYALHINFKAKIPKNFDFKLIYPVIKNNQNLKLGSIVVSKLKQKQKEENKGYSHITVPLFISDQLSQIIDQKYPEINRKPLKPFSIKKGAPQIVKQVHQVIYSLFCALIMENWEILWQDVVLKKINITCGYGIKRSLNRYICLGDSAAHFAYFKSLNFGLKHAFQLIKIVSTFHSLKYYLGPFDEKTIVNRCWKKYPLTWPISARQGSSAAQYFVTNSQLKILAPYLYDSTSDVMKIIDLIPQVSQQKIQQKFASYESQSRNKDWVEYLKKFQAIRQKDIDAQILSNRSKKLGSEIVSYFIWMNSISPIKLSETFSFVTNGYYLNKKDFDYFGDTLHGFLESVSEKQRFGIMIQEKASQIMISKKGQIPFEFEHFFMQLSKQSQKDAFKFRQFCNIVQGHDLSSKNNKLKQVFLLYKALKIIAHILTQQTKQKKQKQVQEIMLN